MHLGSNEFEPNAFEGRADSSNYSTFFYPKDSVTLNVGGKRHEVRWDTLDKFPNSRLGRLRHSVSHRGKQISNIHVYKKSYHISL